MIKKGNRALGGPESWKIYDWLIIQVGNKLVTVSPHLLDVCSKLAPAATSNSPTCGQVKLPHLTAAGAGCLRAASALGKPLGGFLKPPALAFKLQQMTPVHHAVEQRRDHHDVAQELRPVLHESV